MRRVYFFNTDSIHRLLLEKSGVVFATVLCYFFLNGKTSEMRQLGKCRSNVMWKLNLTFSNICACCNHNKTVGRILWSPDWKCYRYKNIFCSTIFLEDVHYIMCLVKRCTIITTHYVYMYLPNISTRLYVISYTLH